MYSSLTIVPTSDDAIINRHCSGLWLKYVDPSVYVLHHSEGSEETCYLSVTEVPPSDDISTQRLL